MVATCGEKEGIPAGVENSIQYGYHIIDVRDQSPFIIQFQNAVPKFHQPASELVDGTKFDLHSQVLGYGKALGIRSRKPVQDHPGQFHLVAHVVYTFYSMHTAS